jgi:hypothetical protein
MTAEADEIPVIGRLLAASTYTDGEKVVKGDSWLQKKCGGTVMRGRRRRDGLTGGGVERDWAMRQRGALGQRGDGMASDRRQLRAAAERGV